MDKIRTKKKEEKRKKIIIIGHFGGNKNITDGQTIKTNIIYEELKAKTDWSIIKIDTYYKHNKPLKLIFMTMIIPFLAKDVIIMLSKNGMRFYFPLLYYFTKIFKIRIYHSLIGGNLDIYIKKYPKFVIYLNSFNVNWVETKMLKDRVECCGIHNCDIIPNIKRLNIISKDYIFSKRIMPIKFCTFSRVAKEKGIEDAVKAIESLNSRSNQLIYTLDIFGPINANYKNDFHEIIKNNSGFIKYRGVIPYNESVEYIKNYTALIFPTYWYGEGFPGTILDAYSAGLPVIATKWNYNTELVKDGITGFLYSKDEKNGLENAILRFINSDIRVISNNCLEESKKYLPDSWIKKIINRINSF